MPSRRLSSDHDAGPGLGVEKQTKALEGTAAGASAGRVVGGVLGLLAGMGTLAIPGGVENVPRSLDLVSIFAMHGQKNMAFS